MDDSEARSAFGTKYYWDELYVGRGDFPADEYSWYFSWDRYGKEYVNKYLSSSSSSRILIPGIGNDPILVDLWQHGYRHITATDYSEAAMDRQHDLLVSTLDGDVLVEKDDVEGIRLQTMDARAMDPKWTHQFDAILEKGALDAIYLAGDGNLERTVQEFERVLRPGGLLISVSGVVPEELRRRVFREWDWVRDGSDDLQAGCFVLRCPLFTSDDTEEDR